MKPYTRGKEKKGKLSSPGRAQRLSNASRTPQAEPTEVVNEALSADWTSQQMARLKGLLQQLEEISCGASADSPPRTINLQDDADGAAGPSATEVLADLAHRFQQDYRLLVQSPAMAAEPDTAASQIVASQADETPGRRTSLPAGVIPLTVACQPDVANSFSTTIVTVSPDDVGLQTEEPRIEPGTRFVLGVEGADGVSRYATLECTKNSPAESGNVLLAQPATRARDLFRPENLLPTLDREHCRYEMALAPRVLARWVELGVLRPRLLDRIAVCPRCFGLPTVRSACNHCGAIEFRGGRLMHHFACAFVGSLEEFEEDGEVVCPKCRMRHLVAGTDFEYLDGPYECERCQASSNDLTLTCQCLQCDHRYPLMEGIEQDLVGYDVDRLDLLALVNYS